MALKQEKERKLQQLLQMQRKSDPAVTPPAPIQQQRAPKGVKHARDFDTTGPAPKRCSTPASERL